MNIVHKKSSSPSFVSEYVCMFVTSFAVTANLFDWDSIFSLCPGLNVKVSF